MTGYALEMTREYPVGPDDLSAAIGAGSLFVARGAMPSSMVAEFHDGGRFTFERPDGGRVSGVFTRVVPGELVEIRWAGMTATMHFEPTAVGGRLVPTPHRHSDTGVAGRISSRAGATACATWCFRRCSRRSVGDRR